MNCTFELGDTLEYATPDTIAFGIQALCKSELVSPPVRRILTDHFLHERKITIRRDDILLRLRYLQRVDIPHVVDTELKRHAGSDRIEISLSPCELGSNLRQISSCFVSFSTQSQK
ncbi:MULTISPECIES: hypothetical protein [Rhizobium]|uniref:Uncharacterized protein n=1 Tax=Rhizobium aouanii TaxID=3118145 RepID=A0ABU8CJB0_9HYPH|nr:hypothetical protein [Rhizobium acaciae]MCW1410843.1 hypothetical protein [Rhizobium acaciae]MCW1742858.1 hypothetical protein [Rhizobium acaciae]MCW1750054.1 hypothetical protein [Rhizobium acaciae]